MADWMLGVAIGGVLTLAGCALAHPAGHRAGRTLRAAGEGRAVAKPDVAVAAFGVEALSPTLAGATAEADEKMRRILDALGAAGVAARDLQTSRFDVSIERQVDQRGTLGPVTGYRVMNEVRATLRDVARVGAVLDAVVRAGSNSISSLAFQREDPSPELSRARAAAVVAARAKAEEMARAAGVTLGDLLELSEGGGAPSPGPMMMKTMAAPAMAVEPGQLEFSVTVEATWAIR